MNTHNEAIYIGEQPHVSEEIKQIKQIEYGHASDQQREQQIAPEERVAGVAQRIGDILRKNRKLATMVAVGASALALSSSASAAETCTTKTHGNTTVERCVSDDGTITETTTTESSWTVGGNQGRKKSNRPSRAKQPRKPRGSNQERSRPRHNHQRNPNISVTGRLRYNYDQGDKPWGNKEYRPGTGSGQTYASSGCGDASLAMVASNLKNRRITPLMIGRKFGQYHMPGGMDHDMPVAVGKRLGLKTKYVGKNMRAVKKELKDGAMAVALAEPGLFTSAGHMITLTWSERHKGFRVADPNGKHDKLENRIFSGQELLRKGNLSKVWTFKKKPSR